MCHGCLVPACATMPVSNAKGACVARLVLDTRANGLVGELSERCRLSGTPLVVAIAEDIQLEKRILGARWDIVRDKACGAFSLTEMCVPSESFAAAKVLLKRIRPGDVVITCDFLVAAVAEDLGATPLEIDGRTYEDPWRLVGERERMRAEGALEAFYAEHHMHVTREVAAGCFAALERWFPKIALSPRVEPIRGARLIVDADSTPLRAALAVARSHDLELVAAHDSWHDVTAEALPTDPLEQPDHGGFWVRDVSVPIGPDAADDEIARIARKGDVVFTNDGGLTKRCIAAGATVVDREGARFSPADFLGGASLRALRQRRYDDLERESPVLSADLRVIDAAEAALALWM